MGLTLRQAAIVEDLEGLWGRVPESVLNEAKRLAIASLGAMAGGLIVAAGAPVVIPAVTTSLAIKLGVLTTLAIFNKAARAEEQARLSGVSLVPPPDSSELPPAPPTNLRIIEVGVDFVVLAWDAMEGGGAVSYNIYYSTSPNGPETLITNVSTTDARITGTVIPGECYRVSAVSTDEVEGGKTSQVCVALRNLRIVATTTTTITLAWDAVETEDGIEYGVYFHPSDGSDPYLIALTPDLTVTVEDLVAGEEYCFDVTAWDGISGESAPSTQVCGVPTPTSLSPPTNLRVESVTEDSITLMWDAVESEDKVEYRVYWRVRETSDWTEAETTANTAAQVGGLQAGEVYCFAVTAQSQQQTESPQSEILCQAPLSAPYSLRIIEDYRYGVLLAWEGPDLVNLPGRYRVRVTPGAGEDLSNYCSRYEIMPCEWISYANDKRRGVYGSGFGSVPYARDLIVTVAHEQRIGEVLLTSEESNEIRVCFLSGNQPDEYCSSQ